MRLLNSLKSDIVLTDASFLGMMKVGKAHLEDGSHSKTSIFYSLLIYFMSTALLCSAVVWFSTFF